MINPIQNKILGIPRTLEEKLASGLFVVRDDRYTQGRIQEVEVMAVGPDVKHVKVGMTVHCHPRGVLANLTKDGGQTYTIVPEEYLDWITTSETGKGTLIGSISTPKGVAAIGDRLLVKKDMAQKGMIIVPDAHHTSSTGTVVSVGDESGVNVGDEVVFLELAGIEVDSDNGKLQLLKRDDILFVV